jgi:hypothetical protein
MEMSKKTNLRDRAKRKAKKLWAQMTDDQRKALLIKLGMNSEDQTDTKN